MKNIVEVAADGKKFNTLVTAVKAAGLADTLQAPGPFTVLAPTDEAFAELPAGTLDAVLKDREKLTAILTNHVVPGKVLAKDVAGLHGKAVKTVQGSELKVDISDGVRIGDAKVTQTDVLASNGVIHVIDKVLIPA